jgi:hypothetical protein
MGSNRTTLRSRIEAAVAPYASSNSTIPPFTIAEIMVMAWACRQNRNSRFISDEEVSNWMFTTLGYYRKLALKDLYKHSFQKCITTFIQRNSFHELVSQRTIQAERIDVPLESCPDLDMGGYRCTRAGAQRFLNRALGGELTKFSNFFKLPAEIRVSIYEEVFRSLVDELQFNDAEFHPSREIPGLRLSQRGKRSVWELRYDFTRTHVPSSCHWSMRPYAQTELDVSVTEPTPKLLALLLVNRQIFGEAMPVFYSVNHFHATELLDLTNMLKHCGARRRPYFTSISIRYDPDVGPRTAIKAFKLLKDVKRLRRLEIETSDTGHQRGPLDSNKIPQLPGMKILSGVRVRELHFTGDCPLIEAYLRPAMEIKAHDEDEGDKGKARGKGKSRKSAKTVVEDEDDA